MKQSTSIKHCPETESPAAKPRQQANVCEVIELNLAKTGGESLSETFYEEIDQWARRALASNGICDY